MAPQDTAVSSYEDALLDLGHRLTRLKVQRGKPSLRAIEARAKQLFGTQATLPIATQSAAFNGRHINVDTLILIVRTLLSWDEYGEECTPPSRRAVELDEWRTRWATAVALQPTRRQSAAAGRPALAPQACDSRASESLRPATTQAIPPAAIRMRDKYGLAIPVKSRAIYGVAFSPDESLLAACSADGTIQLWDTVSVENGGQLRPFGDPLAGHDGPVYGVAFSRDGRYMATGSADGTVRLWDVYSREPVGEPLTGHDGPVYTVAFRIYGAHVAAGGADGTVRQWDTYTLAPIGEALNGRGGPVIALALPAGYLATGAADGHVRQWDKSSGAPAEIYHGVYGPVSAMASNGFTLAVGHASGLVYVRDTRKDQDKKYVWLSTSGSSIYALANSHGHLPTMAAGSHDGELRLWDQRNGKWAVVTQVARAHDGPIFAAEFSPQGNFLATGGADGNVALWDPTTLDFLGAPGVPAMASSPPTHSIGTATSAPATSLAARTVQYALEQGHPVSLPPLVYQEGARAVAFSPDGRLLATGTDDGAVQLWDPVTRVPIGDRLSTRGGMVRSVVFSPDSRLLTSVDAGKPVRLWDTATGKPVGDLNGTPTGSTRAVAFSPDGQVIATGEDDSSVRLWNSATQDPIRHLPLKGQGEKIVALTISSDGLLAAVEDRLGVWLWNLGSKKGMHRLPGAAASATTIAFSPDGSLLAVGGLRGDVWLWSADTQKPIDKPISGIGGPVRALAFSPDACWLAVGGEDQTVWLERVDGSGETAGTALTGHLDMVGGMAFSPDGTLLATASRDQTVRLWTLPDHDRNCCSRRVPPASGVE